MTFGVKLTVVVMVISFSVPVKLLKPGSQHSLNKHGTGTGTGGQMSGNKIPQRALLRSHTFPIGGRMCACYGGGGRG